jgi:hypothetical protein
LLVLPLQSLNYPKREKERRLEFTTQGTLRPVLEATPYREWWRPNYINSALTKPFINERFGGAYWIKLEPVSSKHR